MDQICLVVPIMAGQTSEARDFIWMVSGQPGTPAGVSVCRRGVRIPKVWSAAAWCRS